MNQIPHVQEEAVQIERLAAQRQLYSDAKSILGVQLVGGTLIGVGLTYLMLERPDLSGFRILTVAWGVIYSVADFIWLTPWQRSLKKKVAAIQEAFDCDVLQLPWRKKGEKVDPEIAARAARRYKKRNSVDDLKKWYPIEVGVLPLPIARIICQRSSSRWDAELRRRYVSWITALVAIGLVVLLGLGFYQDAKLRDWLTAWLFPTIPLLIWCGKQIVENRETVESLNRLKRDVEKLWVDVLSDADEDELTAKSRDLQDDLWEQRAKSPLIFDWVYKALKQDDEQDMNAGAHALIKQATEVHKPN